MRQQPRRWQRRIGLAMVGLAVLAAGPAAAAKSGASATAPPDAPAPDNAAATPLPAAAAAPLVEPQVREALAAGGTADVWVYLRDEADLTAAASIADRAEQGEYVHEQLTRTAARSQAGLLALLAEERVDHQPYWIANAVRVTADADLLGRITALPEVAEVTADRVYELPEPVAAEQEALVDGVEWGVDRIGAPQVWDQFAATGDGIVVGVIDSGALYTHEALAGAYRGSLGDGEFDHDYNWHDPSRVCGTPSRAPCDNTGHGTHVAGTIAGAGGIGVAPGAQWIAAKGCEARTCSQDALLSAGQFMLAPTDLAGRNARPDMRPHIVNNSWGGGASNDPWYQATVQAWTSAGIFPVFSAGNWNNPGTAPCGTASLPGNMPESYAVGAFDVDGAIAPFSLRGPSPWGGDIVKPDLAAPGVAVRSAWYNGDYRAISGTSMAAPHVSGTVALMWSAAIALERDVDGTRQLLDSTAIDTEDLTCGGTQEHNNVWGQGELDALAAVEQSPRAPGGLLSGRVTDATTGEAVGGATVSITGPTQREEITTQDGAFTARLLAGDYTATVSAFAYQPASTPVTVVAHQTTSVDIPLTPVDAVTVSGQVTDGSGHSWPLYAEVSVPGTPVRAFTDPVTGRYELSLPAGESYPLEFGAEYPGYGTASATVDTTDGDVTVDQALAVAQCQRAPGYEFSGNIAVLDSSAQRLAPYLEDELGIPVADLSWGDDPTPYDLVIVNVPGFPTPSTQFQDFLEATDASGTGVLFLDTWVNGGGIWLLESFVDNPATRRNGWGSTIPHLYYEVVETHPILDGFAVGEQIVFDQTSERKEHAAFDGYTGEGRTVIANAGRGDTGVLGGGIGVQERANNRHVLLSMHAAGPRSGPQYWTDDAKQIFDNALSWLAPDASFVCEQVDGGLVVGHVSDQNTGEGVNGATVAGAGEPATSYGPVDDAALGDGFYWRFAPDGQQQLTASAPHYVDVTAPVQVAPDAVAEADFALPAGRLEVDTGAVAAEVTLGEATERTFTITNTGTGPAGVTLDELAPSFEIRAHGRGEVRYVEGEFSPAARPAGDAPPAGPAAKSDPAPSAAPWTDLPVYPTTIMDHTMAVVDGIAYSFGGYTGTSMVADTYSYHPLARQWSAVAPMPQPRQKPEAVAIDGRIYVVGGWNEALEAATTTYIYDPATDDWSRGADLPAGRAAAGVTVLDGQLYLVGGCTSSSCTAPSNTVLRYDPATDAWQELASYPRAAAWLGCGGISGELICAGGVDPEGAMTATYSYDPAADAWHPRASLPYDNWGMGYAVSGGRLVFTGGITATVATNRSVVYDPVTALWIDIEPSNVPVYRAAAACGLYRVGGSLFRFTAVAHAERHPDFADCTDEVGVDWLDAGPATATLAPGQSVTVSAAFDSGAVEQPGTYTAGLELRHDTPYQLTPVDVTMEVAPPRGWAKLTGSVVGADCRGNQAPLPGALVRVKGKQQQVTLWADPAGNFAYWLPTKQNNPLELLVTDTGYLPESQRVLLHRRTGTVEVTLTRIC